MSGFLVLEDGTVFAGRSVGAQGVAFGEAVFTTAMTGYQEIVTDPSFAEQIVSFTAPMVGNYGVAPTRSESARVHARAVLMRRASGADWPRWLGAQGIVALDGIDTRALVLHLRAGGAMRAAAVAGDGFGRGGPRRRARRRRAWRAARSSRASPRRSATTWAKRRPGRGARLRLQALDRARASRRAALRRPSGRTTPTPTRCSRRAPTASSSRTARAIRRRCPSRVAVVRELLGRVPVLGICLGHQLLALAAGLRDLQAPVRPPRRQPSGARPRREPRARHEPEPRLRRARRGAGGDARIALRRNGRRARAAGRARELGAVPSRSGPGPARCRPTLESWVEEVRYAEAAVTCAPSA